MLNVKPWRPIAGLLAALLVLALLGPGRPAVVTAHPVQQTDENAATPPAVGDLVLEDPLTSPGIVTPAWCPSSRGSRELTDDGLTLRANGPCSTAPDEPAGLSADFRQLLVRDGEIRVDTRLLDGPERTSLRLAFRTQSETDLTIGYRVQLDASEDKVSLVRRTEDGDSAVLNERPGIGSRLGSGDWTTLSVRMQGSSFWVFIEDVLVLTAEDPTFEEGGAGVSDVRVGDGDDDDEIAAQIRNVRISALASGEMARRPTLTVAEGTPDPPELGGVVMQDPLTDDAVVKVGECPTGRLTGEYDDGGMTIRIHGKCRQDSPDASIQVPIRRPSVGDGELALDVMVAGGGPRAEIALYTRLNEGSVLGCSLNPSTGSASLFKIEDRKPTVLATRLDLHRLIAPTAWNRISLRSVGSEAWVLVNDQPLLYSDDAALAAGGAAFKIAREGADDDDDELVVIFRNLTVSALASGT